MPDEPVADRPYMPGYGVPETLAGILTWSAARRRLETSRNYWLATLHPDGRPHVMPVWGVWMEGELYFSTGPESRKAKNLRADPRCTVTIEDASQPIVVEGLGRLVRRYRRAVAHVPALRSRNTTGRCRRPTKASQIRRATAARLCGASRHGNRDQRRITRSGNALALPRISKHARRLPGGPQTNLSTEERPAQFGRRASAPSSRRR